MTQVVKLREKLVNKLSDLFQLNQPDLDFGFYRIMHAKAAQVQQFIDQDLLTIISDAFGQADDNQVATARAKYEAAIQQAKDFGAPNPEETKPVQEAKAAYDAARESGSNEAQVYDHLYRFFERYYDDGDFISRRYYTRETASNAAPYAIPYNGEEVKLHWERAVWCCVLFQLRWPPKSSLPKRRAGYSNTLDVDSRYKKYPPYC